MSTADIARIRTLAQELLTLASKVEAEALAAQGDSTTRRMRMTRLRSLLTRPARGSR